MTPQEIHSAFNTWKITHSAIRGPLTHDETIIVNEVCDFLVNVAQVQEAYPSGFPYSQDLQDAKDDSSGN